MRDVPRTDFRPKRPRAHCCADRVQFPEENEPPMQGCRVTVCCPQRARENSRFRLRSCTAGDDPAAEAVIPASALFSSTAAAMKGGPEATWACASGKTLLVSYSSAKRFSQEGCAFSTLLSEIKYDGHRPSWQIVRWSCRSRQHWGIEQFEPGVRPRPWGTQSIFRRRRGADALRASR